MDKEKWDSIRQNKWSTAKPPPEWDQSLRPISLSGLNLFALDNKGNLYWDGQPVETRRRLDLTRAQAVWAVLIGLSAIAGGIGGAVQGATTYHDWACKIGWPSLVACQLKDPTTTPS
jgi:hypothetical protein